MSHLSSRSVFTLVLSVPGLCFACASDQQTTNTPDDVSSPEAPADARLPQSSDPATPAPEADPASAPSPQSQIRGTPSNVVASPKPATDATAPTRLSEAQIAMVTDLANSSEIEQGKLAQGKAKSASVKKFAAMMVKHHTEAKAEQAKLFKQLNLTPTQSQTATSLKQNAEKTTSALRASTAGAFDERYIDSQVEAHQQVLDALDNELIPAATGPDLVAGLNKMKATVEAHLREAKSIQAELATSQSTR